MPTLTTTIEDSSPAIAYSQSNGYPHWTVGSSRTDSNLDSYSDASYMKTNVTDASVSFSFYGTGIQLFGSKRPTHGFYQITIDAITYPQVNGNDTQGQFQVPLFSTVALSSGYHTVKMVNLGPGELDLDTVTWQTPIGEVDDTLKTITIQDSDPEFTYSPAANWFNTPPNLGLFSGGSGQATSIAGSYAELKFTVRDAVALYGPIMSNGATFSVSLDGGDAKNYTVATTSIYRPQQILYQAANLQGKEHTLKVQSEAWGKYGAQFIIDYAVVYTTTEVESSTPALSKGAIVGIALGSFFGLVLIGLSLFLCLRFFSKYRKYKQVAKSSSPERKPSTVQPFHQPMSGYPDTAHSRSALLPVGSQPSFSREPSRNNSAGYSQNTPPTTATTWSPPPGTHIIYSTNSEPIVAGPNTQIITIPFTPEGKYRPDLNTAPLTSSTAEELRRMGSMDSNSTSVARTANLGPLSPLRAPGNFTGRTTPPVYQNEPAPL